jgi:hypothetical protein
MINNLTCFNESSLVIQIRTTYDVLHMHSRRLTNSWLAQLFDGWYFKGKIGMISIKMETKTTNRAAQLVQY